MKDALSTPLEPVKADVISIGDWVLLKCHRDRRLVGRELSFRLKSGRPYSKTSASVDHERNVAVYCSWYTVNEFGEFSRERATVHEYISISKYEYTLPRPKIINENFVTSDVSAVLQVLWLAAIRYGKIFNCGMPRM
jgi:hypothetical protein